MIKLPSNSKIFFYRRALFGCLHARTNKHQQKQNTSCTFQPPFHELSANVSMLKTRTDFFLTVAFSMLVC